MQNIIDSQEKLAIQDVGDIEEETAESLEKVVQSWVYILRCADGTYYTGWTTDPISRLQAHNSSKAGAKYTRVRRPVELIYLELFQDKSAAMRREAQIKKLSRAEKNVLVSKGIPPEITIQVGMEQQP